MSERVTYLDSSAIVKRYIEEPGTERVTQAFLSAYAGEERISYSIWNIGEFLGSLDGAERSHRIERHESGIVRGRFLSEVQRMIRLGAAIVVPLRTSLITQSWEVVERYHLYEADALQLTSARYANSKEFMTGDRQLHLAAREFGLKSTLLG